MTLILKELVQPSETLIDGSNGYRQLNLFRIALMTNLQFMLRNDPRKLDQNFLCKMNGSMLRHTIKEIKPDDCLFSLKMPGMYKNPCKNEQNTP